MRTTTLLLLLTLPLVGCADQSCDQPAQVAQLVVIDGRKVGPHAVREDARVIDTKKAKAKVVTKSKKPWTERTSYGSIKWTAVSDYHLTPELAEADALEVARLDIAHFLRQFSPNTQWTPSREQVRRLVRNKHLDQKPLDEPVSREVYRYDLDLELQSSQRDEMLRFVRLEGAQPRLWLLTKGLLGVLAVLGAVSAYFWFDDRTRGYATGWLKFAAIVVILLAALVLLMYFTRGMAPVDSLGL